MVIKWKHLVFIYFFSKLKYKMYAYTMSYAYSTMNVMNAVIMQLVIISWSTMPIQVIHVFHLFGLFPFFCLTIIFFIFNVVTGSEFVTGSRSICCGTGCDHSLQPNHSTLAKIECWKNKWTPFMHLQINHRHLINIWSIFFHPKLCITKQWYSLI